MFNKCITVIDSAVKMVIVLFVLGILVAVTWQVLSRYLLQDPSSFSDEVARFLLIWIGLLGAAYCYRVKSHLSLNIVTEKMQVKNRWWVTISTHVMVLVFAICVMCIGGINLVLMTFDPVQYSPVLNIKMGYIYSVLPLSGTIISLYALIEIHTLFKLGADNFTAQHENIVEAD